MNDLQSQWGIHVDLEDINAEAATLAAIIKEELRGGGGMSAVANTLERLCEPDRKITYGVVKPGPEVEDGILFIRGGDVFQGRIAESELRTISPQLSEQYKRTILKGGELLVSLVGTPGEVAVVPDSLAGANIARQVGLVPLGAKVCPHFVMYFLRSYQGRAQLFTRTQGAVQQVINLADLKTVEIPDVPLETQTRIASILSAYDDLIENNRRRIQLLEQAARLLYREWFVHLRFPGHEHVAIADGVPEGWKKVLMGDFIRFANGKAMKSGQEGRYPVYGSNGIIGRSEEYRHENGIIIGRVGAYCGSIEICRGRFWPSDNTIVATMLGEPIEIPYLFHMLKHMDLNRFAGGAAQPLLTQSNLKGLLVVVPTPTLRLEFNQFAEEIFAQRDCLVEFNSQLTQARDLLLPRLMNGEVAV